MTIVRRRGTSRRLAWLALLVVGCEFGSSTPLPEAFDLLVISDSNGEPPGGWPNQLSERLTDRFGSDRGFRLHNHSAGGRTLSVDRGGPETHAAGGISDWLEDSLEASDGRIEGVVIALGTNDLQAAFSIEDDRVARAVASIRAAIDRLTPNSPVWIVSPPPIAACPPDRLLDARWRGAPARFERFERSLEAATSAQGLGFVSVRDGFRVPLCEGLQSDGVHLSELGHREMAHLLEAALATALEPQ